MNYLENAFAASSVFNPNAARNYPLGPIDDLSHKGGDEVKLYQGDIYNAFINMLGGGVDIRDAATSLVGMLGLGNRDALSAYAQLLIQLANRQEDIALSEQDYQRNKADAELAYQRSLPQKQVADMMSAGMSRSAALAKLQGGGTYSPATAATSAGSISPIQTQMEQTELQRQQQRQNLIFNIVQSASMLASQIAYFCTLPFDLKAKSLTNNILANQSELSNLQLQGIQDASMFMQAVNNYDTADPSLQLSQKPLSEQYQFFAKQASLPADSPDMHLPSFGYGSSPEFKRAAGNPYFWSALSGSYRQKYDADASIYEPQRAAAAVNQIRAATSLVQNEEFISKQRGKIISNEAFRDECTTQARLQLEQAKILCDQHQIAFDDERAKKFLERVQTFTDYDFESVDYQLQNLLVMKDPMLFELQKSALIDSLDYQVATYMYGQSVASLKDGVLKGMLNDPNDAQTLRDWTRTYLQYGELGYSTYRSLNQGLARTIFSGIGGAAAGAFAGYKIFKDLGSAASVASSGVKYTVSNTLGMFAPVIIPNDYLLRTQMNDGRNAVFGFGEQ